MKRERWYCENCGWSGTRRKIEYIKARESFQIKWIEVITCPECNYDYLQQMKEWK